MTTPAVAAGAPAPLSLFPRVLGVITSPGDTFRAIAAHPKVLGVLVLTTVLSAVLTALPMTTPEGQQAVLEQSVKQTEAMGFPVSDQMYEQMRSRMWFVPYQTAIGILVFSPIMAVIIAGLLFVAFNVVGGGTATFKHVMSVLVHAGVIMTLQQVFTSPINYFRGAVHSATNLAVLLPMIDENSFLGRVVAMTDFFIIWYIVVLAIGLAVLYKRRTGPIATTLFAVYGVIVLGFAAVLSRLGGS